MDISAYSIQSSLNNVQTAVTMSLAKKSMDTSAQLAATLIADMTATNEAINKMTGLGNYVDIRV